MYMTVQEAAARWGCDADESALTASLLRCSPLEEMSV